MDIHSPLISILMPVYNRRHLIQRALHSVFSQTLEDWELIIIDDGSTDDVEEDIVPLLQRHANFRYMKHARRGVAASRNIGIHAAMGSYITFLDSDDEYRNDHLELRVSFFNQYPEVDIIHGGVELVGPPETHWVVDARDESKKIHLSECCIGSTFFGKKTTFLKSGGFKRLPYSAESEFLARVSERFVVKKVDYPTYRYYTGLEDSVCMLRIKGGSH